MNEKQAKAALMLVERYSKSKEEHVYNFLSAVTSPFGKSVHIKGSYTCIGFVCHFLECLGLCSLGEDVTTLKKLSKKLSRYLIYEGYSEKYHVAQSWGHDRFQIKRAKHRGIADTAKNINRMFCNYYNSRYHS